jgi:hypothetical protein
VTAGRSPARKAAGVTPITDRKSPIMWAWSFTHPEAVGHRVRTGAGLGELAHRGLKGSGFRLYFSFQPSGQPRRGRAGAEGRDPLRCGRPHRSASGSDWSTSSRTGRPKRRLAVPAGRPARMQTGMFFNSG